MEVTARLEKRAIRLLDRWGFVDDGEWRPSARSGHSCVSTPRGVAIFGGERANGRAAAFLYMLDIGATLPHG